MFPPIVQKSIFNSYYSQQFVILCQNRYAKRICIWILNLIPNSEFNIAPWVLYVE